MENETTIQVVNGSSLGGGEVDAILRASLSGGMLLALRPPAKIFCELAADYGVEIIDRKGLVRRLRNKTVTLVLNGFLRDLTLIPMILRMKGLLGRNLSVVLAVHSDPSSGLRRLSIKVRLALQAYQIFGVLFAERVRFVSERQLETFHLLAAKRSFYVDPPSSIVTRRLSNNPVEKSAKNRPIDFLFIGRLSSSSILGDAKNSNFILAFSNYLETQKSSIEFTVVGAGNRLDVIDRIARNSRTSLVEPTPDVASILRNARVVIVPSIHEGYCLLVREAILSGCLVLTTKAVAPELQTLEGVTVMDRFIPRDWYFTGLALTR